MIIRKASAADLPAVAAIYEAIHDCEASGLCTTGWMRGVYPTLATVQAAFDRNDLFVIEAEERLLACAVINQQQMDAYAGAPFMYPADPNEVMVLHTLAVDPAFARKGYGKAFVKFYERFAQEQGCSVLRMDTNARNASARRLYNRLGYREAAIVPCVFNNIPGVELVLLEKKLTHCEGKE